jgi:acyl-CoA synthetase (AMP-forming)/AMP-acid ligase II
MVTSRPPAERSTTPELLDVSAPSLADGRAERAAGNAAAVTLVSCGVPAEGVEVRIVHPEGRLHLIDGSVGEIWVRGETVAAGYWQRKAETVHAFRARLAGDSGTWLRTGDLGVMIDGALYVTGRRKEIIIVRGQNHYPTDIERTVQQAHQALEAGAGAAFGVTVDGDERVIVVQEVSRQARRTADVDTIAAAVRDAVNRTHGILLHDVLIVEPLTVPKTSSGKVQRVMCRDQWLGGELVALHATALALAA